MLQVKILAAKLKVSNYSITYRGEIIRKARVRVVVTLTLIKVRVKQQRTRKYLQMFAREINLWWYLLTQPSWNTRDVVVYLRTILWFNGVALYLGRPHVYRQLPQHIMRAKIYGDGNHKYIISHSVCALLQIKLCHVLNTKIWCTNTKYNISKYVHHIHLTEWKW